MNIQLVGVSPIVNLFSGQNSPGNISATTSINNIGNILQFPKWESVANFSHYWELPGTMFFSLVKVFIWYQFGVTFPNVGFTSEMKEDRFWDISAANSQFISRTTLTGRY